MNPSAGHEVQVVVDLPAHGRLTSVLSWRHDAPLTAGTLVRVPLGRREVMGVVWADSQPLVAAAGVDMGAEAGTTPLKAVTAVLALPPLDAGWRELVGFAAGYYRRSVGEVALAALPPQLRDLSPEQLQRRLRRVNPAAGEGTPQAAPPRPELSPAQAEALAALAQEQRPALLFGATGSGKTEVYLRAVERVLAEDAAAQALVLVPEINLTPQLEARFAERFGAGALATLHSGLTPAQRLRHWLAAHLGQARIVLGTRMAVFASLPGLRLIVVDEEHDPSYKQQEGARYSARDLAVLRARRSGAQVLLGSATPSLETWHAAERGRYARLAMPARIGGGTMPVVRLVDMRQQPPRTTFAPALVQAIAERVARGEQALVLLNRRGYAPVLHCADCGWKSECPHCSAFRVFHKLDRSLRCHHCGLAERVPRACPNCGNLDLGMIGRGTERLEEHLAELLGPAVRIGRIDADSTRLQGALQAELARAHAGEVDVLVGTQMLAKGHDFRRVTLVAAVAVDSALFASDYRAPERLFALLHQAAGRAGRDASHSAQAEVWVQTEVPGHPLFDALRRHDFAGFARTQLTEREAAGLPPFSHQALLRADARTQEAAQAFLALASAQVATCAASDRVTVYPPVPLTVQRVADAERAQMLLESASRPALQAFLADWHERLHALQHTGGRDAAVRGVLRWAIDVDPLAI